MIVYATNAVLAPIVGFAIWLAAASSGASSVLSRTEIVNYFLVVIFINSVTFSWHGYFLAEDIKRGEISKNLVKPYPIIMSYLTSAIAQRLFRIGFVVLALLLTYFLLNGNLNFDFEWVRILMFLFSTFLAIVIAFNIESIIGVLGFWTTDTDFILSLETLLNNLFSGRLVPIIFLPLFLRDLALFLPFRYTIAFPAEVLVSNINQADLIFGFSLQLVWFVISIAIYKYLMSKGIKSYSAFGS
ncbi:MAG: protein of unknown function DUF990 [uncultured bacterium]|nr:MAG: protein of unknown function DUF990 [uncultured bacterium]